MKDYFYADIVVKGVVEEITYLKVPAEEYFTNTGYFEGATFNLAEISFRVQKVLIGEYEQEYITLSGFTKSSDYTFDLEVGDNYILSARYSSRNEGYFKGGKYLLRGDSTRFLIRGDKWYRGTKDNPLASGDVRNLLHEISKLENERSLPEISKEAELVVRGDVTPKGEENNRQIVSLRIIEILKGDYEGENILVTISGNGSFSSSWRNYIPEIEENEEWIMFLKSNSEVGYYPFAGVNGMFQIVGDLVYRNNYNRMIVKIKESEFKNIIQDISGD
jgi:hypothetical protein